MLGVGGARAWERGDFRARSRGECRARGSGAGSEPDTPNKETRD